jgi:hypothetical protein
MRSTPRLLWLYLLNATVLITHELARVGVIRPSGRTPSLFRPQPSLGDRGSVRPSGFGLGLRLRHCSLVGAGIRRAFRGHHPHVLSAPGRRGFPTPGVSRASRHHVRSFAGAGSDALKSAECSAMIMPPNPLLQGTRRKRWCNSTASHAEVSSLSYSRNFFHSQLDTVIHA